MSNEAGQRQIELALEVLREKTRPPQWQDKPTFPGWYWVEGFDRPFSIIRYGEEWRFVGVDKTAVLNRKVAPVTGKPIT